jgi:hypothetical protein
MVWSKEQNRENAREIMRGNISRDPLGNQLTSEARDRAVEFAVDAWKGDMGNGAASNLGIKHVTQDIIKKK